MNSSTQGFTSKVNRRPLFCTHLISFSTCYPALPTLPSSVLIGLSILAYSSSQRLSTSVSRLYIERVRIIIQSSSDLCTCIGTDSSSRTNSSWSVIFEWSWRWRRSSTSWKTSCLEVTKRRQRGKLSLSAFRHSSKYYVANTSGKRRQLPSEQGWSPRTRPWTYFRPSIRRVWRCERRRHLITGPAVGKSANGDRWPTSRDGYLHKPSSTEHKRLCQQATQGAAQRHPVDKQWLRVA